MKKTLLTGGFIPEELFGLTEEDGKDFIDR